MIDPSAIANPVGFVRLAQVPFTIYDNAQSDAPWLIRRGPAPSDLYWPPRLIDLGSGPLTSLDQRRDAHDELNRLLRGGLEGGELIAVAGLVDLETMTASLIELTATHWALPQTSPYEPFEEEKLPFDWAISSVEMIKMFPLRPDSPFVVPFISMSRLAAFLHAEVVPEPPDLQVKPWHVWRKEFLEADPPRKRRKGQGRPPVDPERTTAIWREVVRRAMERELDGLSLAKVTTAIHDWLSVGPFDLPDETTVRSQLKGLFPADSPETRKRKPAK